MAAHPPGNNPGGKNQLGIPADAYGNVKRLTQLNEEAPMSGSPLASHVLNAPRRAHRHAAGQQAPRTAQTPGQTAQPLSVPPVEQTLPPPNMAWAQIAQIPGVTPVAAEMARAK